MFKRRSKKSGKIIELSLIESPSALPASSWEFPPGEYVLGRNPTCDILLLDPTVSRLHARIFYSEGDWFIEDLGSMNGTRVDGIEIRGKGPVKLKDGSKIVVGKSVLQVKFK